MLVVLRGGEFNHLLPFLFCPKITSEFLAKERAAAVLSGSKDLVLPSVPGGCLSLRECLGLALGCSQRYGLSRGGGQ